MLSIFKSQVKYSIHYNKKVNDSSTIVSCPYFTTNILSVQGILKIRHDDKDSFVIYMCVSGQATFSLKNEKDTVKIGGNVVSPLPVLKNLQFPLLLNLNFWKFLSRLSMNEKQNS